MHPVLVEQLSACASSPCGLNWKLEARPYSLSLFPASSPSRARKATPAGTPNMSGL